MTANSIKTVIKVGLDFGTTHTVAALADEGNYPVLRLPFEYEGEILAGEFTPSCLTMYQGEVYYGPAATRCFLDHFDQGAVLIPSLKRSLLDWYEGRTIRAGGVHLDIGQLLTGFLAEVRRAILRALDLEEAQVEAVIAVPANASSSQRYVTLTCFRQAGFKLLRILDEPSASGIQFVRERYKRWDRVEADVIIYDLGGGTFDTTLLSIRKGLYDPVLSRGISRLGGDDFDELLLRLVEERLGRTFGERRRLEMRQIARQVKEGITPYTQKLHVETSEGVISIPVKEFQEAVQPLLERTMELVDQVMAETKGRDAAPDRIVLVGGGSLLALVPRLLRERFGRAKIHQGLYPFAAVAIGAAIQAASPGLQVMDRLHNHFGVIRVKQDGSEYVDVIFEKGSRLPEDGAFLTARRPSYDPRHNIGRFRYLECDEVDQPSGQAVGEPIYWNEILFPYDRAINPDGRPPLGLDSQDIVETNLLRDERIQEEYYLDEHGIVTTRISRTVQDGFSSCYNLFRRWPV
ncbi:MAG: Hsp70 family protein [Thermodesulfobacteriota bacterium]